MDFSYHDDQVAILELAGQIFREQASHERQRECEKSDDPRFDPALWHSLAEAGILGTAISEAHAGAGLGFLELCGVMEHAGRTTAPAPVFETMVLGALAIDAFGSDAQKARLLPDVAAGNLILTAAYGEGPGDPLHPATTATADGGGFLLTGTKLCVAEAARADASLVSAACGNEVVIVIVPKDASGVALADVETVTGRSEAHVSFDGTAVPAEDVLVGPAGGRKALVCALEWANAAQSAYALGVCEAALELTSDYVKTRKQFDQPIAMFQAVGHRAADAYIDVEAIRLTTQQAVWRLDAGLEASKEVAVAKYWAAEGGQRVVAAAQHLHGGVGVDKEYPLHRYYLAAKHLELTLGGMTPQLLRLGKMLAEEPARV